MFVVGNTLIDDQVKDIQFACDLSVCKGACCSLAGGRGAPLADDEIARLQQSYPSARSYLSERHSKLIESEGMFEGRPGDYATQCVDTRACVFVSHDDGIAKCSLEHAYRDGRTTWRKPLSCHLFPVRIRKNGIEYLRYEELPQCEGGRDRGRTEQIQLYVFLKDSLVRKFGPRWYDQLVNSCQSSSRTVG